MITFLAVWLCLICELLEQVQSLILDCPTALWKENMTLGGDNKTIFIQRVHFALTGACVFESEPAVATQCLSLEKCIFNPGLAAVVSSALL